MTRPAWLYGRRTTTTATIPTAGGAEVEVTSHPDNTILVCLSGCGTCRTFWARLSEHHAAEARGYAQGHAGMCTTKPTGDQR